MRKSKFFRYSFSLKGYALYPISIFAVVLTTRMSDTYWGYLLCLFLMIKVCFTHHCHLWKYAVAAVVFGFIFGQWQIDRQAVFQQLTEENGEFELYIRPDTIRVDGNLLQAQGYSFSQYGKEKVQIYYSLKDKQEKQRWRQQTLPVILQAQATVTHPEKQRNLHGFDYQKFLNQKGIFRLFQIEHYAEIKKSNKKYTSKLIECILSLRRKTEVYIDRQFPKLTSIYLKSLLIGVKDAEFREQQATWQKNGILHLFTLSGMHIFLFLLFFRYFFLRIGIVHEAVFVFEFFFLFFLFFFTGIATSVGRSVLQTGASRSNRFFRWSFSDLDCWSFALMINLLFQPTLLLEAGGQLTYALTFFLLFIRTNIQKIQPKIGQNFCFSFLLTLVTLPFLWYHFHEWYLFSFLFSWLLMPVFSYFILPMCCFILLWSLVFSGILAPIHLFEYFLEKMHLFLSWSSQFSFSHRVTGKMPLGAFLVSLLLLIVLLIMFGKRNYRVFAFVLILYFASSSYKYLDPYGMIAYVDVGQGDSIFIQLPFHRGQLLIDTGGRLGIPQEKWQQRSYQASNASKTVIPFLKSRGVKQLNKVLITHADADHMGDLLDVGNEIKIKELVFPAGTTEKESFRRMAQNLAEEGTALTQVLSGDQIALHQQVFHVLSPFEKGIGENNDSMVVYSEFDSVKFLFTGDLEVEGEQNIMTQFPQLKVDVLKAGHHGSKTSSSPAFVAQLDPNIVILSCGKNNRYGHPHDSVLQTYQEQGTSIYRTDEQGMIYFSWIGNKKFRWKIHTIN